MNRKYQYMKNLKFSILILAASFVFANIKAQVDIQREVRVVKPYTPTLTDASKINILPEFTDTVRIIPEIDYSIQPKRFNTQFRVKPIQAARMKKVSLERLYKSQFTLGMGNYLTPYGELTVNQLRERESSIGLHLLHQSSGGKVKLENNEKVASAYSDNQVDFFAKKLYSKSVMEGKITGGYNSVLFYGYNPELDTVLKKDDIRQKIYSASAEMRFYSTRTDSNHLEYNAGMKYLYTQDGFSYFEHGLRSDVSLRKFIGDWYTGADIGLQLYSPSDDLDTFKNSLFSFSPVMSKSTPEWKFMVGLNATYDKHDDANIHIYPRAKFEFNIVKDVLIPYMGLDGYREVNNYRKLLFENPFIRPGFRAKNSDYGMIAYFGMKGKYSSKMSFDMQLSYSTISDMYFYVNDTSLYLQNQFIAEYDNGSILKASGEVTWNQNENLRLVFSADYYKYELDNLEHPWHRPAFEASLSGSYNLRDKILVDASFFYSGKRYAYGKYLDGQVRELQGFFDANLAIEYRYTKLLSFFVRLNNFAAAKYNTWNQYPVQRFQILGGFTYAL